MNVWHKNSVANLLPLSKEKQNFEIALKEWFFTGEIVDHEQPIESCKLCEHESLRYHYEIKNHLANTLWVGSKCIEKFDITIYDADGKEITEKKERYLINEARKKHIKNVFDRLIQTKPKGSLIGVFGPMKDVHFPKLELDQFCMDEYFLRKDMNARILNYLFLRLDEEGIFYEKKFFRINLQSQEQKAKLLMLARFQFERIQTSLSKSQQTFYNKNKY